MADWASQRDLIRALVKRVEVARNEVNVVFRIDPYPGDGDPEKKVCNFVGSVATPPCGVPLVVAVNTLLSSTPAWSHAFTRRFSVGNVLSLRRRVCWLMRSK